MSVAFARPDVSELIFHVYERALHPELFQVYGQAAVNHVRYSAVVRICEAGHWVTLNCGDQTISEVCTSRHQLLPEHGRRVASRLRGHRDESSRFGQDIMYHASFQLERLNPDVYLRLHEELLIDCNGARLAFQFPGTNRFAPGPLSLIQVEASYDCLGLHTFHTFPENCAIVKTQSLFEVV